MSWAPSTSLVKREDEEYDSYDELMEDGDDEESLPPTQAVGSQNPGLISGALRPYRTAQIPAISINMMVNQGDIDLEVEYQRDVVWTDARQEGLIDSMFCNYFVPPVLFSCRMNEDGTQLRVCMDGKQRLTSIVKFMNGQIPWRPKTGPGKGKRYWYLFDPKVHKGLELPKRERAIFDQKQIQTAEFDELTSDTEREIFQRVQLGMALSPAEKLQALATQHSTWISSLVNKYVLDNGTGGERINVYYSDWKQDRGQAFQNICVLVYMIEKIPAQTLSVSATVLHNWLMREDSVEMFMRRRIDAVFTHYVELLSRYADVAISACGKRLSPIEFSFIGVILYVLGPYISLAEMAVRIGNMRVYIRTVDTNVRSNGTTIRALWAWLDNQPKKRMTHPSLPPLMEFTPTEGSSRKRRRPDAELNGGDDGDYVGGGVRGGSPSDHRSTRARV